MPDTPATESCAPASPIDAAQVLEDMADLLLIHGRCRDDALGPHGEMCVLMAMNRAATGHVVGGAVLAADKALRGYLDANTKHGPWPVSWNFFEENDDEVRDTLLLVAKDLRNTAVPS